MRKKPTLTLDIEDAMPGFEGYAFLLFGSTMPNYAFVDDLNRMYGLALRRVADLELQDALWPLFTYNDRRMRLQYYLVERPAASSSTAWPAGHKMLIVRGEEAESTLDAIHEEFSTAAGPAGPDDTSAAEHYALLENFLAAFTLTRRIDPTAEPDTSLSRKGQREQSELAELLADIVDHIDIARC